MSGKPGMQHYGAQIIERVSKLREDGLSKAVSAKILELEKKKESID